MAQANPPRGMRDFLPEDVRRRRYVIGVVTDVYERYGFEPLETPAVENLETLLGKYGEEGNQLIFKILKRGEHEASGQADLALRYDLTVPLARVVANYRGSLPRFFKRYQVQPVWRADRPARGRFREFYQCDVDVLGSASMVVEAEICAAAADLLRRLGFEGFTIRLNHRQVLRGVLETAGVSVELHEGALVALDKLDRIGADGVRQELDARGVSRASADAMLTLFGDVAGGPPEMVISRLRAFVGDHPAGVVGLGELGEILRLSADTPASGLIRIDPGLARGLSYYTGAIMEVAVSDLVGSLGGGGRYDRLVGMFLGQDVPACGFSLGLERILVVMTERNMFPAGLDASPADVMVTQWNIETAPHVLALAKDLRAAGLRVDVYPEADKLGKQFKYASARNIPLVAVLADDELARGEVTLKDLRTGEQTSVKRSDAPARCLALLPS